MRGCCMASLRYQAELGRHAHTRRCRHCQPTPGRAGQPPRGAPAPRRGRRQYRSACHVSAARGARWGRTHVVVLQDAVVEKLRLCVPRLQVLPLLRSGGSTVACVDVCWYVRVRAWWWTGARACVRGPVPVQQLRGTRAGGSCGHPQPPAAAWRHASQKAATRAGLRPAASHPCVALPGSPPTHAAHAARH